MSDMLKLFATAIGSRIEFALLGRATRAQSGNALR
jgi:hypothetical protein